MKRQILFVGNDSTIFPAIQFYMQGENIGTLCVNSAREALEAIRGQDYCLVIIIIQSTETQEIAAIRMIRSNQKMPIIALSDKLTTPDKVALFHAGVNACIEKPVDLAVCTAQAISLIRLYGEAKEEKQAYQPLIFGKELIIDTLYRQIIIDGEPLELTRKEYELFVCLVTHPCQIWSLTQLYRYVWDDTLGLDGENTVKTHIGNIKKKLANLGKSYIQNTRGVGYKFVPPACGKETTKY